MTAAAVIAASIGILTAARLALLFLAVALAVQAALAAALLLALTSAHEQARDLIAQGRGDLPLVLVTREKERLLSPKRRNQLARSYERVISIASGGIPTPLAGPVGYRSGPNLKVAKELTQEMHDIARLLRHDTNDPRGVLLAQRLLTSGGSPLYGRDTTALHDAITRIQTALTRGMGEVLRP